MNVVTTMTTFRLTQISKLTAAEWARWLEIQQSSDVYESPYFRPEFARAVAEVRDDVEVAVLEEGGEVMGFFPFQRGKLNLGKPVGGKLSDYHGPLVRAGAEFDALALVRACGLAAWDFDHLVCGSESLERCVTVRSKSPQMDLSSGYEAYARQRRDAGSDAVHRSGQKSRKMAREVGPLAFTFDAEDEEAYRVLLEWKSAQLLRTGLTDIFAFGWTRALLTRLREHRSAEFGLPLSVLWAGDQVAAVALSLRSRGVLHSWFAAYNAELATYSPGITLFARMAEEAPGLGIRKIDLGRGDERYKWSLATGSVPVCEGSIACPSLATWLRSSWRRSRDWVSRSPLKGTARLPAKLIQPLRAWLAYH
jgi:CelD/BcsL family acetyltransferase involved in cellulose biosynthesis